jgi:hypothetical protein
VLTEQNGNVYDGKWENDMKHGKGKYKTSTGEVSTATWEYDLANGKGTFRNAQGNVTNVVWYNGVMVPLVS